MTKSNVKDLEISDGTHKAENSIITAMNSYSTMCVEGARLHRKAKIFGY